MLFDLFYARMRAEPIARLTYYIRTLRTLVSTMLNLYLRLRVKTNIIAELLCGRRPQSGAPLVSKSGNLSIQENLVMTSAYALPSVCPHRLWARGRGVPRQPDGGVRNAIFSCRWFLVRSIFNTVIVMHSTGSRGVKFELKNYSSYILFCKIYNLVILSNKFAQCDLCKPNLNGFLLFPHAVFVDLCDRLVRHSENCYEPRALNPLPFGQWFFIGKLRFPNEARSAE